METPLEKYFDKIALTALLVIMIFSLGMFIWSSYQHELRRLEHNTAVYEYNKEVDKELGKDLTKYKVINVIEDKKTYRKIIVECLYELDE